LIISFCDTDPNDYRKLSFAIITKFITIDYNESAMIHRPGRVSGLPGLLGGFMRWSVRSLSHYSEHKTIASAMRQIEILMSEGADNQIIITELDN
jgi:hypothetical protein